MSDCKAELSELFIDAMDYISQDQVWRFDLVPLISRTCPVWVLHSEARRAIDLPECLSNAPYCRFNWRIAPIVTRIFCSMAASLKAGAAGPDERSFSWIVRSM